MGSYLSSQWFKNQDVEDDSQTSREECALGQRGSKKRSRDAAADDAEHSSLHTPKKMKLKSTTNYIYQVLFINGENSDITINALEKEWKLHKLYLKQCGYFDSMFNGSWKETTASVINLDIPDSNINAEALSVAFGCLYRDDLTIEPVQVVPVVAAACLLQLDGLMQQCAVIMKETISSKTVSEYYECSTLYGLTNVKSACLEWLENNIMVKQSKGLLKNTSSELMLDLIKSPNLFVMQVEMDVYNLLKRWLFLQLVPWWNGSYKSTINKHAEMHFKDAIRNEFGSSSQRSFLETSVGKNYRTVFAALRFQHIIVDLNSTNLITKDRIIPKEWLMPFFKSQWSTMLHLEQGDDLGPTNESVNLDTFLDSSLRCARILYRDVEHQWRWIGFNYGLDLVVTYVDRAIVFKRNCGNQCRLLSNHTKRHIMLRVTASCVDDLGHVTYTKTGGVVCYDLVKDGEKLGLSIDKKATMPMRISLNVLYYTPKPDRHRRNLLHLPLRRDECHSCWKRRNSVTAICPTLSVEAGDSSGSSSAGSGRAREGHSQRSSLPARPSSVGSADRGAQAAAEAAAAEAAAALGLEDHDYASLLSSLK